MVLITTKNYEGEIIKLEVLYDTYECPHNSNVEEIKNIILRDWSDFNNVLLKFFKKNNLVFKCAIVGEETSFAWKVLEQKNLAKFTKYSKIKNIKSWFKKLKR